MKTYFALFFLFISFSFISCANETEVIDETQTILLKSKISNVVFEDVTKKLFDRFNETRSDGEVNLSEEDALQILSPFVEDGKELHKSLLEQINAAKDNMGLTPDEIKGLTALGEDELALFSFIVYEMEQSEIVSRAAVSSQLISCLAAVTGISSIKAIWVSGLINAKTVTEVLIAQGRRYLGYVGVALMVYSFVDCIS